MSEKNENLDELLGQFFDDKSSQEMRDDIRQGDKLLDGFSTPVVDENLIEVVKQRVQIAAREQHSKRTKRVFYRTAAVAVLLFGVMLGMQTITNKNTDTGPVLATAGADIWGDDDFGQDSRWGILSAEIEELEGNIRNIRLDQPGEHDSVDVTELEMEMVEIAGGFWKG